LPSSADRRASAIEASGDFLSLATCHSAFRTAHSLPGKEAMRQALPEPECEMWNEATLLQASTYVPASIIIGL
jgi:hypothetical protein